MYTGAVRTVATRALVGLLVWALTPGLAEVSENAWHLLLRGHAAHAADQGPDHAPVGDEHGCSGPFHLCSCHHSQAFDRAPAPGRLQLEEPCSGTLRAEDRAVPEPALPGLDRPPRA